MEVLGFILLAIAIFISISGLIKAGFFQQKESGVALMFFGLGVAFLSPLLQDIFFLLATGGVMTLETYPNSNVFRAIFVLLGVGLMIQMFMNMRKFKTR